MDSETKIIGIDLLSKPKTTKRKKNKLDKFTNISKKENQQESDKNLSELDIFRLHMTEKISNFKLPLEPHEQRDPIKVLIESCYYFYKKSN